MPTSTAQALTIYEDVGAQWWDGSVRWVRTLAAMVPARLRHFERVVPDWHGLEVLDVGCAGGFLTEALAEQGARVAGVDPAASAVASARAHATATGLQIDYRVGVGEDLPWPAASFDVVTCVDVLEHVGDVDRLLVEAARVLRPGGWFLFDTINRNPLSRFVVVTLAERVLRLLPHGAHDPALFIKPDELRTKLDVLGFEVGSIDGLGPTGLTRGGDFTFGSVPTTAVIYIGAAQLRPNIEQSSMIKHGKQI